MSVLLVDECCGSESAEGDRSLQSKRGLQSGYQTDKKNPQLGVWLWVPLHAQHRQIKRNLATTAIIFAMRVMQMTQ